MAARPDLKDTNGELVPIPDPTILTTQMLLREVAALKELMISTTDNVQAVLGQRLGGMDKAIELLQQSTNKMPDFVRDQVSQLRSLHDERFVSISKNLEERDRRVEQRFDSIDTQFAERDKRTEQLSLADKTAIAAALQAQKEAAGATNESNGAALAKMENNFTKLIEQGQTLVQSVSRNLEDKINDLKGRFDRGEGKTSVSDPAVADTIRQMTGMMTKLQDGATATVAHGKGVGDAWGYLIGAGGLVVAVVAIFGLLQHH